MTTAKILPQINFSIHQWKLSQNLIVEDIITKKWEKLVIRSSGESEDKVDQSLAGEFLSIINVPDTESKIISSVEKIILSFKSKSKNFLNDKILIQPYLSNTNLNGVAFSVDLKNAGPYFVINFDESNKTDAITSGSAREQKIVYIKKYS